MSRMLIDLLDSLKEPDLLYDFHSSMFCFVIGLSLLPNHGLNANLVWGLLLILVGAVRAIAVIKGDERFHSISCLMSCCCWVFLMLSCFMRHRNESGLVFLVFSLSSMIKYFQLVYSRELENVDKR